MVTLTLFLLSLFSVFERVHESQYFRLRWKHSMESVKDEHLPFKLLRSIVALYSTVVPMLMAKWYAVFTIYCITLLFPVLSLSLYYLARHKLDKLLNQRKIIKLALTPRIRLGLMMFGYVLAIGLDLLITWAIVWAIFS